MTLDLSSKKTLVVEDQAIMRETIKHILSSFGIRRIVEVESGVSAITAMRVEKFDIVLCDYNLLNGKNGQQVLEEARYLKLLPINSIFIMVTGEQTQNMVLTALDNKPDDYLIKPFNWQQLLNRIQRCYSRKTYLSSIENEIDSGNLYQAINNCEKLFQANDKKMRLPLLKMYAELTIKVGDFKTAEAIYQSILQERELPWARLGLGVTAFFLGYYDQAIDTFHGLIEQYPMMLETYDWLVKTHEAQGNDDYAISSLHSAVTLSPMSILRQKKLAWLADKTENLPVAKKAYTATIKLGQYSIHRSSADYSGLGNVYLKTNASNEALKLVNELNQQFHNDPEAQLRAALLEVNIHQAKGNKGLAQQAYSKAFKLNEKFGKQLSRSLRLEIAKAFYLNGNVDDCENILRDLIQKNIDDKAFIKDIVTLCNTLIDENYADKLIQDAQKELIDINNAGVILHQEGNIKGALAIFERASEKMPNNHTILLNMIKISIHDIKSSKPSTEKIMQTQAYINKAIEVGIPHEQVSELQSELNSVSMQTSSITR
ncbi:MAG: response regulator [Methylobacter sp.]